MLLLLLQALLLNSNEVSALVGSLVPITVRPFHVSIYLKNPLEPRCGGCVISRRTVLTAAHCFRDEPNYAFLLRAGYDNLDDPVTDRYWHNILKYVPHKDFAADPSLRWENDIAIVIVAEDFVRGPFIHSVPMSTILPDPGHIAYVSSYTEPWPRLSGNATVLAVKDLQTWNRDRCQEMLTNITTFLPNVSTTQFCAIDPYDSQDSRIIDGGAPITTSGKLLGIASWEPGCELNGTLTFYTTVAPYAAWIEAETKRYL